MAYQSLYRRYRSQNFSEIKGQAHVTTALRTAVAENRHSHAYLFSGPRGTGKTSTARVLAKALNCENLDRGEPCGVCKSCVDIQNGTSFDLHELDAASNNKVDDVRDLIAKVALGSPGRTKVYILDEVHMLSPGAENALLKTLEEPPDHVVFVLATTEPQKVVSTIRSRTQHFEFKLLPGDELADHVRFVIADAGLDVDEAGIDYALRQGGGSARDTLSALDLVAAAGGVPEGSDIGLELALAIGQGDAPATVAAVERAIEGGREPRSIGETTVETLRQAFLASMGAPLNRLNESARNQAGDLASKLGPATITRTLEMLGQALIDMRQAPDPRVPLEVALLRLARRDGADTAGLLQRIEQLEAQVASLHAGGIAVAAESTSAIAEHSDPEPSTPEPSTPGDGLPAASPTMDAAPANGGAPPPPARLRPDSAAAARANLADNAQPPSRPNLTPEPAAASPTPTPTTPAPAASTSGTPSGLPLDLDSLVAAIDSGLLDTVSQRARVRFATASPVAAASGTATFSVPNNYYLPRCEEVRTEIEGALAKRFGQPVIVAITVAADAPAAVDPSAAPRPVAMTKAPDEDDDVGDIDELTDAGDVASSGLDRLSEAFPGSQVIESFDHPPH